MLSPWTGRLRSLRSIRNPNASLLLRTPGCSGDFPQGGVVYSISSTITFTACVLDSNEAVRFLASRSCFRYHLSVIGFARSDLTPPPPPLAHFRFAILWCATDVPFIMWGLGANFTRGSLLADTTDMLVVL